MDKAEWLKLTRAIYAASNAFHETLRDRGYSVSYGGADNYTTGTIFRADDSPAVFNPMGTLSIQWKLKKIESKEE